jgi:hypothetical protein
MELQSLVMILKKLDLMSTEGLQEYTKYWLLPHWIYPIFADNMTNDVWRLSYQISDRFQFSENDHVLHHLVYLLILSCWYDLTTYKNNKIYKINNCSFLLLKNTQRSTFVSIRSKSNSIFLNFLLQHLGAYFSS